MKIINFEVLHYISKDKFLTVFSNWLLNGSYCEDYADCLLYTKRSSGKGLFYSRTIDLQKRNNLQIVSYFSIISFHFQKTFSNSLNEVKSESIWVIMTLASIGHSKGTYLGKILSLFVNRLTVMIIWFEDLRKLKSVSFHLYQCL